MKLVKLVTLVAIILGAQNALANIQLKSPYDLANGAKYRLVINHDFSQADVTIDPNDCELDAFGNATQTCTEIAPSTYSSVLTEEDERKGQTLYVFGEAELSHIKLVVTRDENGSTAKLLVYDGDRKLETILPLSIRY